ncbi:YdcF family protein [Gluconacetobacter tumulisoli]|uniref:YdcF family protein n=1 Tax=Gluconacetobacter tumulisoli TaxID=1286189 RepID=A0A7W4K9V3_9PROT|nr:YdcF family protein [Gluconacetobacter tumulisoli]MBB2202985.1 YdcF family protein [Gluconacetobacter tumulisoli]
MPGLRPPDLQPSGLQPIVIFGARVRPDGTPTATLRRRVEAAIAYARSIPSALFIPTGGSPDGRPAEAAIMVRLLREAGIPDASILAEDTALDTLDSVLACSALLRGRGYRGPVAVASSAYHLPRCLVLMRLAGWRVARVPPPRVPAARRWSRRWFWRLREIPAVPWDAMLLLRQRVSARVAARPGDQGD